MGIFYCCVKGCSNNSSLTNISLFRFPKEHNRCLDWAKNCGRADLENLDPNHIYNNYRVCSIHFKDEMFSSLLKNRLKRSAIPTMFILNTESGQPQPGNFQLVTTKIKYVPLNFHSVVPSSEKPQPSTSSAIGASGTWNSPLNLDEALEMRSKQSYTQLSVQCQTSTTFSADYLRENELRTQVRSLKRKLFQQESQLKKSKMDEDDAIRFCQEHFSQGLANFIRINLDLQQKNPKGYIYSNEYKQFALTVYFLGPMVYKFMSKMFRLPSKSTLYGITQYWNVTSGLNDEIFSILESKVSTLNNTERDCILCIDEMSLRKLLFYNKGRDKIIGSRASLGGKTYAPVKSVLVCMARGISHNWKQPVAYFFVNVISAEELENIIFQTIGHLQSVGLNIVSMTSNQRSNFVNFTKRNDVTDENPFFFVNDKKIFYMFDIPHLLKSLRNNLFAYEIKVGNMSTNKKYIELFYEKDKQLQIRLAPKLSGHHMNPSNLKKMKVKLAAQVLSATVAAALSTYVALGALPPAASFTATFIGTIDKLFDIFNSFKISGVKDFNRPFTGSEKQISFLNEMYTLLDTMKVLDRTGKDVTKSMKFINGWKISIMSFLHMWEVLKQNHTRIYTRRLNQDCLEFFFGKIRQQSGNCRYPTPNQFAQAFKKMFCLHYFENYKGTNCVDTFDELLLAVTADKIKCFQNVLPLSDK